MATPPKEIRRRRRADLERLVPAASVRAARLRWCLSTAEAAFIAGDFGDEAWRTDERRGAPLYRFRSFCAALGEDYAPYLHGAHAELPPLDEAHRLYAVAAAVAEIYELKAYAARARADKDPPPSSTSPGTDKPDR